MAIVCPAAITSAFVREPPPLVTRRRSTEITGRVPDRYIAYDIAIVCARPGAPDPNEDAALGRVARSSIVAFAVALAAAPAAAGQASPPSQMPTFSVAVTAPGELIVDVGTTRRIDRSEIQARRARTLDEALGLLPGVYVRTAGDGAPRIDVRGFRSRHILLLVDGVPVNSTDDGQFDPARISTESIREIKVSYGSSSLLYGDNAMAGVIEIVTDGPEARPSGGLALDLGSRNKRDAGGRITGSRGKVDFLLAGNSFATDGFRLPGAFKRTSAEDGGLRANSDRARHDVLAKIGYHVSESPEARHALDSRLWVIRHSAEHDRRPGQHLRAASALRPDR